MPALSGIGASAVQLVGTAGTSLAPLGVMVKADDDNTGSVYVGFSSAVTAGTSDATDGLRLKAGQSFFIPRALLGPSADLNGVWVIASASGQKIGYIANANAAVH